MIVENNSPQIQPEDQYKLNPDLNALFTNLSEKIENAHINEMMSIGLELLKLRYKKDTFSIWKIILNKLEKHLHGL